MMSWIFGKTLGKGMFALAAMCQLGRGWTDEHSGWDGQIALDVETVFDQLREIPSRQLGSASRDFIGTRVKATGYLCSVTRLTDDLMSISVAPHGVKKGSVSIGVPAAEYEEIIRSEKDITLEGEIEYMELEKAHALFLSDAGGSVTRH
jgi:hypothetical protein